jgi:spore maturation protein SpmA
MKSMDDKQLKMMIKAAGFLQGGARVVQRIKAFLFSNAALVVAVVVILLAILLRWLGVM